MIFIQQLMSLAFVMLLTTSRVVFEEARDVETILAVGIGCGDSEQVAIKKVTDSLNTAVDELIAKRNSLLHQFTHEWHVNVTVERRETTTIHFGNGSWCCITGYRLTVQMQKTSMDQFMQLADAYSETDVWTWLKPN